MKKIHAWEREYRERKLVTLGTQPSEDMKRFVKWLKRDEKVDLENKKVLDAGCGTGKNSFYLIGVGAQAEGYDISETAIKIANDRKLKEGLGNEVANFFTHNMTEKINFTDETFDIWLDITSSNALTEGERTFYLKESFRALRKGGYLFLRTLCKDGDENAKYLIKNFAGPEKDMYKLKGTNIVERAFTKEDLLKIYKPYGEIKFLEKVFHYPTFEGRIYKRAYWLFYLQKI